MKFRKSNQVAHLKIMALTNPIPGHQASCAIRERLAEAMQTHLMAPKAITSSDSDMKIRPATKAALVQSLLYGGCNAYLWGF